jgi:hypothetical protein
MVFASSPERKDRFRNVNSRLSVAEDRNVATFQSGGQEKTMSQKIVSSFVIAFVFVFGALAYAAAPTDAAPVPSVRAVLPDPVPVDLSSVGVGFTRPAAKVAPKGAKVATVAKVWTCGGWVDSQVGGGYKRCEWR